MNRLPEAEKGSILVWTAVILAVLIAFAGLATDIPYLYVAKRQAQTAADAGAIAGAYGLLTETAGQDATTFAGKTPIIGDDLTASEIDAFVCNNTEAIAGECTAATGAITPYDQVTTITHRDVAHGNPMPLFVLPVLQIFGLGKATANSSGWDAANVSATATARIFNTCSGECFKPWSIPDKWDERSTPPNDEFNLGVDVYDPVTTGYQWPRDNGTRVTLKVGPAGNTIIPSFFYAVDFPPLNRGNPVSGANVYEENIATCGNGSFVAVGDQLQKEPGAMIGPTRQGVEALKALDPTAFWDPSCNCVNSPKGVTSPRLIRIAFFDPQSHLASGRNDITVTNVGGFFVEGMQGNDVVGYYTQVVASGGSVDPTCAGLQTVQLVK